MFSRTITFSLMILSAAALRAQGFGDSSMPYSSTLEEGAQRGYADIVRSVGMANLLTGQAAVQVEQARKAYIENQARATQTYFELRRYNAEARHRTPLSLDQYVRLARDLAPDPLTATQLDPLTGTVSWPAPLRIPQYEAFRQRLDRLFQDRATGYLVYGEIQQTVQEFEAQLKADLMRFPPDDYIVAKKFLDSLAWAARGVQS